jgi:hypothetical protein
MSTNRHLVASKEWKQPDRPAGNRDPPTLPQSLTGPIQAPRRHGLNNKDSPSSILIPLICLNKPRQNRFLAQTKTIK